MANSNLFITIVWLVTAVSLSCPCFATPMWTDCSSIGTNFIASPGGGDFEAVGCLFPSKTTNVSLSSISSGSSASVFISDGIVTPNRAEWNSYAQSGIWVVCPAALTSPPQGPLNITVARMAFGQDACFRFTGALPPGSSLVVASNSFYLTQPHIFSAQYPGLSPYLITAILIGTLTDKLSLTSGTTLSVANNTMKAIAVDLNSGEYVGVFIVCPVLTITGSSTLAVDGNSVNNSNVYTAYAAYVYIYSTSSAVAAVGQGSTLSMKRNSVVQSTISRAVYAAYLNIKGVGAAVMLTNRSLLDLSDNAVGNVTATDAFASSFIVYSGSAMVSFVFDDRSKIKMNGNRLWNCSVYYDACSARLWLRSNAATLLFDGQSSIDVSANMVTNSKLKSVDVALVSVNAVTAIDLALSNRSSITMGSNGLSNCSANYGSVAQLLCSGNFTIFGYKSAVIAISGNFMQFAKFNSPVAVALVTLESSSDTGRLMLSNQSVLTLSRNSITNCVLLGRLQVAIVDFGFHFYRSSISLSLFNQSAISLNFNRIDESILQDTYVSQLTIDSLTGTIAVLLSDQSSIQVSFNTVLNCDLRRESYVAYMNTNAISNVVINSSSALRMDHNAMHNSSFSSFLRVVSLGIGSDYSAVVSLQSSAVISMSYNSLIFSRTSSPVCVYLSVRGPLQLAGQSSILSDNNTMIGSGPNLVTVRMFSNTDISMTGESTIQVSSNLLSVPSQDEGAILLHFESSYKLAISGGSALVVKENSVKGLALMARIEQPTAVATSSFINISANIVDGYQRLMAKFDNLKLEGSMYVENNQITSVNSLSNYQLVTAAYFSNGPMSVVRTCGNIMSWDSSPLSGAYLSPSNLAANAQCNPTTTSTTAITETTSTTPTSTTPASTTTSTTPTSTTTSTTPTSTTPTSTAATSTTAAATSTTVITETTSTMWSDCSSIGTNFIAPPGGGRFEAVGCLFPRKITNVSLTEMAGGSAASVLISDGFVQMGEQSGIWVVSPASSISKLLGPLNITVARMAFGQDASFRFTGALPPGSSLVVASNSFYLTQRNIFTTQYPGLGPYIQGIISVIPAILIGTPTETLSLTSGTALSVANNTMKAIAGDSTDIFESFALVFIVCPVLTITGSSTLAVDGNSVNNSNVNTAHAAFVYIYSTSSASASLQLASTLSMKRNSVLQTVRQTQSISSAFYAACFNIIGNNAVVMLTNRSRLDLSDNAVGSVTTTHAFASSFNVSASGMVSFLVSDQSKIKMNGNRLWSCSIKGVAYPASLSLTGYAATLLFDGQSSIDVSANTITNSKPVAAAFVSVNALAASDLALSNNLELAGHSRLMLSNKSVFTMSRNSITNCGLDGSVQVAFLQFEGDSVNLGLFSQSAVHLNFNRFDESTLKQRDSYVEPRLRTYFYVAKLTFNSWAGTTVVLLSDQSSIQVSFNTLLNCELWAGALVASMTTYSIIKSTVVITASSALRMENNTMQKNRIPDPPYLFRAVNLVIGESISSAGLSLQLSAVLSLSNNSLIQTTNEFLSSSSGCVYLGVRGLLQLAGQSSILSDSNTLVLGTVIFEVSVTPFSTVRMSVINISMTGESTIQVSSNFLSVPSQVGMWQQEWTTLLLFERTGLAASNAIAISGGSAFFVKGNSVKGLALLARIEQPTAVATSSTIVISANIVDGYQRLMAKFANLTLNGSMFIENNQITSVNSLPDYQLVSAAYFNNGPMSVVRTCGNRMSWDSSPLSGAYLSPSNLAANAQCNPTSTSTTAITETTSTTPTSTTPASTEITSTATTSTTPTSTAATSTTAAATSTAATSTEATSTTTTATSVTITLVLVITKPGASPATIKQGALRYSGIQKECQFVSGTGTVCAIMFLSSSDADWYILDANSDKVSGAASASIIEEPSGEDDSGDLSRTWLIVGIVVGAAALVATAGGGFAYWWFRMRTRLSLTTMSENEDADSIQLNSTYTLLTLPDQPLMAADL